MSKVKKMPKMNLNSPRFGVNRWMFAELDDIELLIEIGILSNCSMIGYCKVCRIFLEWCLKILYVWWDYTKYIDFYDALKVISENRELFTEEIERNYWRKHRKETNEIIEKYKATKDRTEALLDNTELFKISMNLNSIIKTYIESSITK